MKRSIIATTLALCVGCATGVAVRDIVVPARAQNATGPTYDYQYVHVARGHADEVQGTLSKFGREGWRLASSNATEGFELLFIFERPRG